MSGNLHTTIYKNFLSQRKYFFIFGTLSVGITCFCQVLVPRQIGKVIDLITKEKEHFDSSSLLPMILTLLAILLILTLSRFGWRSLLARQSHHALYELRAKVFEAVRFFKKSALDEKYSTGHVMNIATSDVNLSRMLFGFTIVGASDVLFLGSFSLMMIAVTNFKMFICTIFAFSLHPILLKKLADKEIREYGQAQQELSRFNDQVVQAVSTIKLQRLSHTSHLWNERLVVSANDYRKSNLKARKYSLLYYPLMGSAEIISYVVLFLFGISAVLNHEMSIGEFVAIQSYIMLLQGPVSGIGHVISEFQQGLASFRRLGELYSEPWDEMFHLKKGATLDLTKTPLVLTDLNFSYKDDPRKFFNSLSLTLHHNEHIGISGQIGTGKSTLLRILAGLERGYEGKLLCFGKPFSLYDHKTLRKNLAIVPQRTFLFADSIRNNIALGKDLSDEEIWKALEIVSLKSEVEGFPNQLASELGENGINLSGGQKQRLTLARAIAKKPKIMFIDDALSAVDTVTEEIIVKNLKVELKETSVIWVAHRESTLAHCSHVINLETLHE